MGGSYAGLGNCNQTNEFNFILDPHAADIVFKKLPTKLTIVPWETVFHPFIDIDDSYQKKALNYTDNG